MGYGAESRRVSGRGRQRGGVTGYGGRASRQGTARPRLGGTLLGRQPPWPSAGKGGEGSGRILSGLAAGESGEAGEPRAPPVAATRKCVGRRGLRVEEALTLGAGARNRRASGVPPSPGFGAEGVGGLKREAYNVAPEEREGAGGEGAIRGQGAVGRELRANPGSWLRFPAAVFSRTVQEGSRQKAEGN